MFENQNIVDALALVAVALFIGLAGVSISLAAVADAIRNSYYDDEDE